MKDPKYHADIDPLRLAYEAPNATRTNGRSMNAVSGPQIRAAEHRNAADTKNERGKVPGSVWRIEDEKDDEDMGEQEPLFADGPTIYPAAVIQHDARNLPLPDDSVDLIVTSPPYWALRSYTDGGEHYDGQLGSEATPKEFIANLVDCTREWVRVLKPSGSLFVNLGDKYAGSGGHNNSGVAKRNLPGMSSTYADRDKYLPKATRRNAPDRYNQSTDVGSPWYSSDQYPASSNLSAHDGQYPSHPSPHDENESPHNLQVASSIGIDPSTFRTGARDGHRRSRPSGVAGIRPKSLMGLPWRYALECIDTLNLILRAEIIWDKPNGLPESVRDRVARKHEQWFHFVNDGTYHADIDPIREMATTPATGGNGDKALSGNGVKHRTYNANAFNNPLGKVPPSVWRIASEPLRVPAELGIEHFAAFPSEWPIRLIKAWSPPGGVVLDPFGGTGTTALAAQQLGRYGITNDLSTDYCRLAQWRLTDPKQIDKINKRIAKGAQ